MLNGRGQAKRIERAPAFAAHFRPSRLQESPEVVYSVRERAISPGVLLEKGQGVT